MLAIQCIAETARNHSTSISGGEIITAIFVSAVIIGTIFYMLQPAKKEDNNGKQEKQE